SPNVPALTRMFAVPIGADVSVQLLGSTSLTVNGVRLWPQQDEAADAEGASPFAAPAFLFNPKEYSLNAFSPPSPVGTAQLGTLRDLHVGGVETDGAQYNPVAQSLRLYTGMDVHVAFGGKSTGIF